MSSSTRISSRPGDPAWVSRALLAAAILLAVAGACALAFAFGQSRAPLVSHPPSAEVAGPAAPAGDAPLPPEGTQAQPVSLEIPAIAVNRELLPVGLAADRTLEVPPYDQAEQPGWYERFPAPGERGPAVIVGHVDSPDGPAVFNKLGTLTAGDEVRVRRSDGITAIFVVDRVTAFPKDDFPSRLVYGAIDYPGLRLITCGGPYDAGDGGYQDNIVVFASLTRFDHPAA